jgi:hypothetical protein
MRIAEALFAVLVTATGCAEIDTSKPPEPGAIKIAGHPYWTTPGCKRDRPLGKWDSHCDIPRFGLPRGFANSDFNVGGPSIVSTKGMTP